MENKAIAEVISLVEKCDVKLNLVQIMEHRIPEECLSLFNTYGTMVKMQKSKLVEKLNLIPFQTVDSYIALIDMGFICRLATPSPEDREKDDETHFTWLDYANKLFSLVMARHPKSSEIIYVNDPYDLEISVKDNEHEQRTGGAAYTGGARNTFIKRNNKLPSPNELKTMFKTSGNKIRLQQFLKKEFRLLARQCPTIQFVYSLRSNCWHLSAENEDAQIKEFQCYHIKADTILLMLLLLMHDAVVIDAEDNNNDVIVLAAW